MSRRGDSFTTRNSTGHGIYRLFGIRHNRKAFLRDKKGRKKNGECFPDTRLRDTRTKRKETFFQFLPPSFLGNRLKKEKRGYLTRRNRFVALKRERKLSPFVFFHSFFSSSPSVENKRCQPSSSSACNAITRKVPLNPPWTVNQTGRPAVFNSSTRALHEFIGETELPFE